MSRKLNRRTFLGRLTGAAAGTLAAGVVGVPSLFAATAANVNADGMTVSEMRSRSQEAYRHWRSDRSEGLKLVEAVDIGILTDLRTMYHEDFSGFSLITFDGKTITI